MSPEDEQFEDLQSRLADVEEKQIEGGKKNAQLLQSARFVFSTLTHSANHLIHEHCKFAMVIIDEAGYATEASTLVPLRCAPRLMLVGDHQQLRPIVADTSIDLGYDRPLIQRLVEAGHEYTLLDTQYRSNPAIAAQSSEVIYGGRVTGMPPLTSATCLRGSASVRCGLRPSSLTSRMVSTRGMETRGSTTPRSGLSSAP